METKLSAAYAMGRSLTLESFENRLKPLQARLVNLRDELWPVGLLLRTLFRTAVQEPGITVTILAATLPFIPTLLEEELGYRIAAMVLMLPPLVLFSGFVALWAADPQAYARFLFAGRPAKEVLFLISWHSVRACERTKKLARRIEDRARALETKAGSEGFPQHRGWVLSDDRSEYWEINKFRERLRRFIQKEHSVLLRIEAMKVLASEELDIPQRRLCDHVLQYSPAMHRDRLHKYLGGWGDIMDSRIDSAEDAQRFRDLLRQNRLFLEHVEKRAGYQRQMLRNRDLHSFIVQLASMHSTSGSLHTYAEALKFLIVTGLIRRHPIEETAARLVFLHRKQRAHPGFDLHTLLCSALRSKAMKKGTSLEEQGRLEMLASVLQTITSELTNDVIKALSQPDQLKAFLTLPADLSRVVSDCRQQICQRLKANYDEWFEGVPGRHRYIVSHGYSKTVLSVLKSLLAAGKTAQEELRIFFVLPEEKESFDTRVMEYELREDDSLRTFRNFAAGTDHHLFSLLSSSDSVLVLLGAECFDEDGWVVHPRGIAGGFGRLLERLQENKIRCLTTVVAESYKRHRGSLRADTDFYGQHFDRIELYSPEWINRIVTDA
jgi:hypothetical protein